MRKLSRIFIALALSLAMGAAFAQTLTFDGNVMVSSGDTFVTASNGQTVVVGQSIQVAPASTATITYPDGTRIQFPPGTYVVPTAAQAAGMGAGTVSASGLYGAGMTAAIVGGVVILSAALIDQVLLDDDEDDSPDAPPVSP